MSNPVFYAEPAHLAPLKVGDFFTLGGAEGRHAVTVKRLEAGEAVDVNDGAGLRLICVVTNAHDGQLEVRIVDRIEEAPVEFELVLVQALAKGDRDELAIETATELGVDGVIPWQSERSIVRWKMDKAIKGPAKWRNVVAAAAKQARRSRVPWVGELVGTAGLVDIVKNASLALILHEDATVSLPERLATWRAETATALHTQENFPNGGQVVMIVGPEGGISPAEISAFTQAGASLTLLGPHVLRSSTAGPAAVVLLSQGLGRW